MWRYPHPGFWSFPSPSGQLAVQEACPLEFIILDRCIVAARVSDIARRAQAKQGLQQPAIEVVREAATAKSVPGLIVKVGIAE